MLRPHCLGLEKQTYKYVGNVSKGLLAGPRACPHGDTPDVPLPPHGERAAAGRPCREMVRAAVCRALGLVGCALCYHLPPRTELAAWRRWEQDSVQMRTSARWRRPTALPVSPLRADAGRGGGPCRAAASRAKDTEEPFTRPLLLRAAHQLQTVSRALCLSGAVPAQGMVAV